jgi:hypothetical protein
MGAKYDRHVRQTLPIVIFGTSAWFVALVIELAVGSPGSSVQICAIGIVLGLLGTIYILRGLRRKR